MRLSKICRLFCFLGLAAGAATASPLPTVMAQDVPPLSQVGAGEGRKFGLHIYDATLWTGADERSAVALHIEYKRRISGRLLVKAAIHGWKRMTEIDPQVRSAWSRRIAAIWPDVKPGDSITTLVLPGRETRFFNRNGLLGVIDDPAFGPALLGIWLDARSEDKPLRAALLGHGTAGRRIDMSSSASHSAMR